MMSRWLQLIRRHIRARGHGVRFVGMSRTRLPGRMTFAGESKPFAAPAEPLVFADFVNVVLDDDYGLRSIIGSPRTIVDIGANVGFFANFARHLFPTTTIHAYEPSPATAAYARINIKHPLTTLFVEGVAATAGRAEMAELGSSNLARTVASEAGAIVLTGFATVIERIGGWIDLLKIDCEGAEWDVMRDPALFARVGAIRMEYHLVDGRSIEDVERLAAGIGFKVARRVANDGFGIVWLDPVSATP